MVAVLATLLFTTAFAVSIWAMFTTIAPRLDYMRALLRGDAMPALAPVHAPRVRATLRAAPRQISAPLRAAA
ncbi:hypothetical protein [Sphingomonas sp.]|uniref:hypothetical protein n=1 Tax=Sphingomonas sp. TaxID=28214 RepID=UPI00179CCEF9|nr:hypothetical protein [Sphingomonas sp.]MBA4761338.1 hypothetical protein [Sphingomonas sp.]